MHIADVLNDPNLVATVFAPTNDAFVALEKSLGYTQEQLLNSAILKPTLLYHVVPKVAAQVCEFCFSLPMTCRNSYHIFSGLFTFKVITLPCSQLRGQGCQGELFPPSKFWCFFSKVCGIAASAAVKVEKEDAASGTIGRVAAETTHY